MTPFTADLSKLSERQRAFDAQPDIKLLVNHAGAIPAGDLEIVSMETWRKT